MAKTNHFHTIYKREIKQLRTDARKLETIAKHMRIRAKEISDSMRADQKGESARVNFYSKQSKVDPDTVITPDILEVGKYR